MVSRQIDRLARRAAWLSCVLAATAFGSVCHGTETTATSAKPADLNEVESLLQQSGATHADLVRLEKDMAGTLPSDLHHYLVFLRQASAVARVKIVEGIQADVAYTIPGADSLAQADVLKGQTIDFALDRSKLFPGSTRKITVYIPAQYRADRPACLFVSLDGLLLELPTVFDNLIARHEMPVTIAIGVTPGTVPSERSPQNPRFNRSIEFDSLNDRLARFLLEEVLPAVEQRKTPDGLRIWLSHDPNDRAIGGLSTGGIGAFTVAWELPDAFRRVFSAIGTFVDMRGGDRYAALVRKTEPKPIRIFMQDGALDEWMEGPEMGDWWLSNQTMDSAFVFAGYSVKHVWGNGSHSGKHAALIFPDAMRWLWRDWPRPIRPGESQNTFLRAILKPGANWERAQPGDESPHSMAPSPNARSVRGPLGRLYESDSSTGQIWLTHEGQPRMLLDEDLQGPTGIALSPDGLWLAVAESKTHWGYSYKVERDGTLSAKQRFYWFHTRDDDDNSGVGNWVMDREGRLYAATALGIQVFDRNGRVRAILPTPGGVARDLWFGGEHLERLYIQSIDGRIYRREFNVSGAPTEGNFTLPVAGPG